MTLLSNKKLINNMESMAEMVDKLKVLLLAFSDQDRAKVS